MGADLGTESDPVCCANTGHCKQLAPNWAKAAEELAPRGLQLGAVDCTANEELCARFEVKVRCMSMGHTHSRPS